MSFALLRIFEVDKNFFEDKFLFPRVFSDQKFVLGGYCLQEGKANERIWESFLNFLFLRRKII